MTSENNSERKERAGGKQRNSMSSQTDISLGKLIAVFIGGLFGVGLMIGTIIAGRLGIALVLFIISVGIMLAFSGETGELMSGMQQVGQKDENDDPAEPNTKQTCHDCGWQNPQKNNFCHDCGSELS